MDTSKYKGKIKNGMKHHKGTVILEKIQFTNNEFVIGVSTTSDDLAKLSTPTFKRFLNICVGSPNMTLYKTADRRDKRYELGKQMLLHAGYTVKEYQRITS